MVTLAERIGSPGPPPGPDATRLVRRVHDLFDLGGDVRAAAGAFLAARASARP